MILYLYAFLILLQVLDAYTTYTVIKRGGKELNPVLLKLSELLKPITKAKWSWLFVAKAVAIVAGTLLLNVGAIEVLAVLCAVYTYIVIHNFLEMKKQWKTKKSN